MFAEPGGQWEWSGQAAVPPRSPFVLPPQSWTRRYISTFKRPGVFVSPQLGSAGTLIGAIALAPAAQEQPLHVCLRQRVASWLLRCAA